jgi:hypothetical protein
MAIRVCQFITELRPAGAERCVLELARRLPAERFRVQVAALRGGPVADWLRAAGVPVHVLNVRGKWDLWRASTLGDILKAETCDILHTHLFHADVLGRPTGRNPPRAEHGARGRAALAAVAVRLGAGRGRRA